MDESWRMRIGIPNGGVRSSSRSRWTPSSEWEPEDFEDVFGGPPKSLLTRKLSADFTGNEWFYRQVFQPPEIIDIPTSLDGQRSLPEFEIPGENRPCKRKVNKRISRSKSTSASVMSVEEMSEMNDYWSGIAREQDTGFFSMSSKLRPINVPSRWSSSSSNTSMAPKTKNSNQQELPPLGYPINTKDIINNEEQCNNEYMIKSCNYNCESNSPSSGKSRWYEEREMETQYNNVAGSYLAETNSCKTEDYYNNSEENDINEAIAWAKDKFQGWSLAGQASPREHTNIINHV